MYIFECVSCTVAAARRYVPSTQMDCKFFIFGQNQSLHPWALMKQNKIFCVRKCICYLKKNIAENSQQFPWSIFKLNTANLDNYCNKVKKQFWLFIATYQQSIKSWFKISTMHINRTEVTNIKSEHIFFFVLFSEKTWELFLASNYRMRRGQVMKAMDVR